MLIKQRGDIVFEDLQLRVRVAVLITLIVTFHDTHELFIALKILIIQCKVKMS